MSKLVRILIPGLVLQGLIIGGGYATGRELIEFFLQYGLRATWFGLMLTASVWSLVFAVAFAFARETSSYNYGAFTKALLGPVRYAFDVVLLAVLLLIVAVICTAAGEIAESMLGVDPLIGAGGLAIAIAAGLLLPPGMLGFAIAAWSVVLYVAYGLLAWTAGAEFGPEIQSAMDTAEMKEGWITGALQYSAYNLAALPAALFVLQNLRSQSEAVFSGLLAGFIVIAPSVLIAIILAAFTPGILAAPAPLAVVLESLSNRLLAFFMQIAILGTFWQTGVGTLHALNDRIALLIEPRSLPVWARPAIAFSFIGTALILGAAFGVIALIARGYAALTIGFLALLIAPLLTFGLYRVVRPVR